MTQTNPEQWADKVLDDVIIAWSEHGHSAGIEAIQAAFAEREAWLVEEAEDREWGEARELVRGTNADMCMGGAGQAYRHIIEKLTNAIHNRNLRTFAGRVAALKDRTHG